MFLQVGLKQAAYHQFYRTCKILFPEWAGIDDCYKRDKDGNNKVFVLVASKVKKLIIRYIGFLDK